MFGLRKKIIDHLGVFFIGGLFHGKVGTPKKDTLSQLGCILVSLIPPRISGT